MRPILDWVSRSTCMASIRCHLRPLVLVGGILAARGCCTWSMGPDDSSEGCGSASTSDGGWSGSGASGGVGGTGGQPGGSGGAPDASEPCAPHDYAASIPAGWELQEPWSCYCPLFVPSDPDLLPLPLGWGDCGALAPDGYDCAQLSLQLDGASVELAPFAALSTAPESGAQLVHFQVDQQRGGKLVRFSLVAEDAAGTVRHAIAHVLASQCDFGPPLLANDGYAIGLAGGDGSGVEGRNQEGIIGGLVSVTEPQLSLVVPADPDKRSAWLLTPSWVVRNGSNVEATSWDGKTASTVIDGAGSAAVAESAAVAGAAQVLFVESVAQKQSRVAAWSLKTGLVPLLGGDASGESAGEFSTDEIDMVWTRVSSEAVDGASVSSRSLMTAPVSINASEVHATARRALEDVGALGQGRWSVGCGRAARVGQVGSNPIPSLVVVTLADGSVAETPGMLTSKGEVEWVRVVGLTCSSVYVLTASAGKTNLWKLTTPGASDAGADALQDGADDVAQDASADPDAGADSDTGAAADAVPNPG